jgi:hypothetical protein
VTTTGKEVEGNGGDEKWVGWDGTKWKLEGEGVCVTE